MSTHRRSVGRTGQDQIPSAPADPPSLPPARRRSPGIVVGTLLAGLALAAVSACGPTDEPPAAIPGQDGATSSTPASPEPSEPAPSTPSASDSPSAPESSTSPTAPPTSTSPSKAPALLEPGDKGEKVRDLQVRLREISWLSGKISGTYDEATEKAVAGFQVKRDLPKTGEVDQKTWDRLVDMTHTPTHDQKHNVMRPGKAILKAGMDGKRVRELQARLKQVGWFSDKVTGHYGSATTQSVKGFQAKREIPVTGEVDQRTWDRLAAMTHEPTAAELADKPPAKTENAGVDLDKRCMTGRVMCISKSTRQLAWVVDGTVVKVMDARFGCSSSATREGVFQVGWKSRDHTSTEYDSWMPYAMFFSGGQAVHYSEDFAARGYAGCSHGCVNIRDKAGITWLFDQVRVGDRVVVHW